MGLWGIHVGTGNKDNDDDGYDDDEDGGIRVENLLGLAGTLRHELIGVPNSSLLETIGRQGRVLGGCGWMNGWMDQAGQIVEGEKETSN